MRQIRNIIIFQLALGWLLLGSPVDAQPPVQQVLVLQSLNRGNLIVDSFTGNFRVELDRCAGRPVNIIEMVVGPTGFVGASEKGVVDYIKATFADRPKPDLILAVSGPATGFARKHRNELFPDAPLLFAAVDEKFVSAQPLGTNDAAVAVVNDFPRLVDEIVQLRPQTRHIFMIMGSGQLGRFWRQQLEEEFKRFSGELNFIWSNDLSFSELVHRCATLPPDSAIFYLTFGTDALGAAYADERVISEIHATANAPLFSLHSPYFGLGTVGGSLISVDDLSSRTAQVAVRILNGAAATSISVQPQRAGKPTFDARELQRWNIPESRLPTGSMIRYRSPGLWEKYKVLVVCGASALLIQSFLIIGLLYQRRARQRAELQSRKNLELAGDVSRRETMAALSSSIAHEISQPLGAIILSIQAVKGITRGRHASETVSELLSDIERQGFKAKQIVDRNRAMLRSQRLEKKPVDLHSVITEGLALVRHDMKRRQIKAVVHQAADPCVVSGDQVLLQQVIVNLITNAMDAMADTHPERRKVLISSEATDTNVIVSVRDAGEGLPESFKEKVFTSFVTTKEHGLGIGLTIARQIVEAHGGSLDAHNNAEGGATFTLTLPTGTPSFSGQSETFGDRKLSLGCN